jgi:hypothetical protein
MYFPHNWEFGSALSKLQNFGGGGVKPPNPSLSRYATGKEHSFLHLQGSCTLFVNCLTLEDEDTVFL